MSKQVSALVGFGVRRTVCLKDGGVVQSMPLLSHLPIPAAPCERLLTLALLVVRRMSAFHVFSLERLRAL